MNFIAGAILRDWRPAPPLPDVERHERYKTFATRRSQATGAEVIEQKMEGLNTRWRNAERSTRTSYKSRLSGCRPRQRRRRRKQSPQAPEPAVQPPVAPSAPQLAPEPAPAPPSLIGSAQAASPQAAPPADEIASDPETRERVAAIPGMGDDEIKSFARRVRADLGGFEDEVKRALADEWDRRFPAR